MKRLLFVVLLLVLGLGVKCSAQLFMSVKSGADKWGYAGGYLGAVQSWNGSRFELETCAHFPTQGKPGYLPRESWFGFYVQDTAHGHRYCPGVINLSWNMSPDQLPLGATRHERSGGWDPLVFKGHNLPVSTGQAIFRLRFEPAANTSDHSSLMLSYSTDGVIWKDAWNYAAPADFTPDRIGLTADSYLGENSFGPVSFDYFKVIGDGPAVSDLFDGSIEQSKWQMLDETRGEIRFKYKLKADFQPDTNGFVFLRNEPAHIGIDLKTNLLAGKTVDITGKLLDYDRNELKSISKSVAFEKETMSVSFDLPKESLNRNGVYRLEVEATSDGQKLGHWYVQFVVVDPRKLPGKYDTSSPYMYCTMYNYNAMRRIGVFWLRGGWFSWECPRKPDGSFKFDQTLDSRFAAAKPNKIMPMGPICGPNITNELPESIGAYVKEHVDWISQTRKRYGSAFRMIEIGNEPENWPVAPLEQEWILMARGQADITRRVHKEVRGVKVMSTGTTHINLAFLGQLAAVGGQDAADIIGVHGYRTPSSPEYGHEEDIRAIKALFPNKPIWVNEQAYSAFPPGYNPTFEKPDLNIMSVDEMTQGVYLVRLMLSQLAAGYSGVSWYGGPGESEALAWSQTHLRPGICTLAALTSLLPHPKFERRLTPYMSELWALQFTSDKQKVTVIWSIGPRLSVRLPAAGVAEIRDVFGNPVKFLVSSGQVSLTVGQVPFYVLGNVEKLTDWKPASDSDMPVNPLIAEEQKITDPVYMQILPNVSSMKSSMLRVRVTNTGMKAAAGIVTLKSNDKRMDKSWPEEWKFVGVNGDRFSLDPGASADLDFRIDSSDPNMPFDPYHPGPGFFANWWLTGYFFVARATLDSGERVDCLSTHGLCLRGAPRLGEVKIDGNLGEWSSVPVFPQMGKNVRNIGHNNFWFGEADYKPTFKFAWCPDGLLFSAEVEDDIQHQIYTGEKTWECDSIDVAVDAHPSQPSAVDFHLFTLSLTSKGPQCYRRRATKLKPEGLVDAVQLAVKRVNPDYGQPGMTTYEVLIPWSEISSDPISTGAKLGFAVQFNESDGWGRIGWEGWFLHMGGQIVDPRRFGDLTLVQE